MKTGMKLFLVIFALILSLGFFFTPKTYADYPPNYKIEIVFENGHWVKYVYDQNGGIVEVIIISND